MSSVHRPKAENFVFVSYNRLDRAVVLSVKTLLADRGIVTFLDSEDLPIGEPWAEVLEDALRSAAAVLVFVGPHGFGDWQKSEIYLSLQLQQQAKRRGTVFPVVPVLINGADPNASFLFLNTWVDLRGHVSDSAELDACVRGLTGNAADEDRLPPVELQPYRGLYSFREEDRAFYFGRKAIVQSGLQKIDQHRIVSIVGASGAGKSSLVAAGIVPSLRALRPPNSTWEVLALRPGTDPWRNAADGFTRLLNPDMPLVDRLSQVNALAAALDEDQTSLQNIVDDFVTHPRARADRLLIVIDQFEELFTQVPLALRARFINALLGIQIASVTLLIALRADYYDTFIACNRQLSDAACANQISVGPLNEAELRMVIEQPARVAGTEFAKGLVNRIIADVTSQPGALPLLEYALTSLWNERDGHWLTHEAYERIGCVAESVAHRAEAIYLALDDAQRRAAQELLVRLVRVSHLGSSTSDTRHLVTRPELTAEQWLIAQRLADVPNRLLVISSDNSANETIELAHEALIHYWERLKNWLDHDRDFLIWRQQLETYLTVWEDSGRQGKEFVLRGEFLYEAQRWQRERYRDLSTAEQAFITASSKEQAGIRLAYRVLQVLVPTQLGLLLVIEIICLIISPEVYQSQFNKSLRGVSWIGPWEDIAGLSRSLLTIASGLIVVVSLTRRSWVGFWFGLIWPAMCNYRMEASNAGWHYFQAHGKNPPFMILTTILSMLSESGFAFFSWWWISHLRQGTYTRLMRLLDRPHQFYTNLGPWIKVVGYTSIAIAGMIVYYHTLDPHSFEEYSPPPSDMGELKCFAMANMTVKISATVNGKETEGDGFIVGASDKQVFVMSSYELVAHAKAVRVSFEGARRALPAELGQRYSKDLNIAVVSIDDANGQVPNQIRIAKVDQLSNLHLDDVVINAGYPAFGKGSKCGTSKVSALPSSDHPNTFTITHDSRYTPVQGDPIYRYGGGLIGIVVDSDQAVAQAIYSESIVSLLKKWNIPFAKDR